jgi:hypothetical protein
MDASHQTLAALLSQACLIGATIEYAEIVRRRVDARGRLADLAILQESGLAGLVRIFIESETENECHGAASTADPMTEPMGVDRGRLLTKLGPRARRGPRQALAPPQ